MRPEVQIEGLEKASKRLTEELQRVGQAGSEKFVTLSLKMVEAQAAPLVPVDTSELINSAFTKLQKLPGDMGGHIGEFGYGAEYAGFVHEGGPKNWKKAGATDRFLEIAVDKFIAEDLDDLLGLLGE